MRAMTALAFAGVPLVLLAAPPWTVSIGAGTWRGAAVFTATAAAISAAGLPPAPSASLALLAGVIPAAIGRRREEKRQSRDAGRWPDFLTSVRSRLAAGTTLPGACSAAGRLLGGRFEAFALPAPDGFAALLGRVRREWPDPLADRVVTTLLLAHQAGGPQVAAVIGALSQSVSDELRLRRTHDAAMTEQRLTAGVALLAPWVILALSILTNPAAADAFRSPTGTWIVAGGCAATLAGYVLARRAVRLAESPRVFS